MKNQPDEKVDLERVLTEMAAQDNIPAASELRDWLEKYPQFRHEIIEFVTDWIAMAASESMVVEESDIESVVNCTMSRVQKHLADQDAAHAFTDLFVALDAAGVDLTTAENELGIDRTILTSLSKRLIQPQTIPLKLVESLGTLLACSAVAIRQYLSQPPLQSAAYKAHGQLQARQLEFGYFVEHADLADDDKTQWLKSDPDPALKELMCG